MKKTYQQEQYNELHSRPKSRYEQFQDWLNECPVQIEDYQDNTDHAIVRFDLPFQQEVRFLLKVLLKNKLNLLKVIYYRYLITMNFQQFIIHYSIT